MYQVHRSDNAFSSGSFSYSPLLLTYDLSLNFLGACTKIEEKTITGVKPK